MSCLKVKGKEITPCSSRAENRKRIGEKIKKNLIQWFA